MKSSDRVEREYGRQLKRFRRKGNEKSIHLLRVMTRRLLAMLDLFAESVPPTESKKARKRAKEISTPLGPLRDIQIQLALLPQVAPESEALEPFYADLRAEIEILSRDRQRTAGRKIPGPVRGAFKRIRRTIETAERKGTGAELALRLHKRTDAAFRRVKTLARKADPRKPETIHKLRIAFKRFRYMAEFLAPVTPALDAETLQRYRWFQGSMGEVQDICELEARLQKFVATRSPRARKAYQPALSEIRQEKDARLRKLMRAIPEIELLWS